MKNDIKNLVPQEVIFLARFCQNAMLILNARLFTLLGMLLCAMAFGWVMWLPDWTRFAAACAFAVIVYLPAQRMESRRIVQQQGAPDGE